MMASTSIGRGAPRGEQQQGGTARRRCQSCLKIKNMSSSSGSAIDDTVTTVTDTRQSSSDDAPTWSNRNNTHIIMQQQICNKCQMKRKRRRIQEALQSWDMFPPPPPYSISADDNSDHIDDIHDNVGASNSRPDEPILCTSSSKQNKRRNQLITMAAVPIGKLPTIVPTIHGQESSAKKKKVFVTTRRTEQEVSKILAAERSYCKNEEAKKVNDDMDQQTSSSTASSTSSTNNNNSNNSQKNQPQPQAQPAQQQHNNHHPRSLIGATIRIKKGKYANCTGKIIECQSIRRVTLNILPTIAFDINDISIVSTHCTSPIILKHKEEQILKLIDSPLNHNSEEYIELHKLYMGVTVKITNVNSEYYGKVGVVHKVIVGDWYVTDNNEISNAFKADKFEILRYANDDDSDVDEVEHSRGSGGRRVEKKITARGTGKKKKKKKQQAENSGTAVHRVVDRVPTNEGRTTSLKHEQHQRRGRMVVPLNHHGQHHQWRESSTRLPHNQIAESGGILQSVPPRAAKVPAVGNAQYTRQLPEYTRQDFIPPSPVVPPRSSAASRETPKSPLVAVEHPELVGNERDLIGATIRIKKGRYKGLTGVIEESNTLRRFQLDTVDVPMGLDNVEILWYEPQEDHSDKYLGAKVRVKPPHPHSGKLGRIIKVVILGNWYITNNPAIKTAFPSSKFDILRYANGDVPIIDMLDDDSDEEEEEEEKSKSCSSASDPMMNTARDRRSMNNTADFGRKGHNSVTMEGHLREKHPNEERNLIGATVRIKKGRMKGLTGRITEKQTLRRLKLDTISEPVGFDDIIVLAFHQHADSTDEYLKFVGAKVRLKHPHPKEGTIFTVEKVIVLGDWFVTDNKNIHSAFPLHKFDVLRYANGELPVIEVPDEEEKDGDDGDEDKSGNQVTSSTATASGYLDMSLVWKNALTKFYQDNEPTRVVDVDKILEMYKGKEAQVFVSLAKRYKQPNALNEAFVACMKYIDTNDYLALTRLYLQIFNPLRVNDAQTFLTRCKGQEHAMFEQLSSKWLTVNPITIIRDNQNKKTVPQVSNYLSPVKKNTAVTARSNEERADEQKEIPTIAPTKKNRKSFSERIDQLKAYKAKHGNLLVRGKDDLSLYKWCTDVRRNYPLMTEDRKAILDAIGFDWQRSTVPEAKNSKEEVDEECREFNPSEAIVNQVEPSPATRSDAPESSKEGDEVKEQPETKNTEEASNKEERTLIGATIRIKKGRSKGLVGVITEKNTIRRLQLDTITAPVTLDNVSVIQYGNIDHTDEYQKYVGAHVQVEKPHPDEGKLGKVVKVIEIGDWYITDNPEIHTAFPSHKFDILKYANGDVPGDIDKEEATERSDSVIVSSAVNKNALDAEGTIRAESNVDPSVSETQIKSHIESNMEVNSQIEAIEKEIKGTVGKKSEEGGDNESEHEVEGTSHRDDDVNMVDVGNPPAEPPLNIRGGGSNNKDDGNEDECAICGDGGGKLAQHNHV